MIDVIRDVFKSRIMICVLIFIVAIFYLGTINTSLENSSDKLNLLYIIN